MEFQAFQAKEIKKLTSMRANEVKIGESILAGSDYLADLSNCPAAFVLIGIPEDIGPRANCGRGGADSAWLPFLGKFLNIQETSHIKGKDILLLGAFDFNSTASYNSNDLDTLRNLVNQLDELVSNLIEKVVKAEKTPIVIGGGHNNCYGIIKGISKAKAQKINVCNLDPHADYRSLEGRHSGNGFSYAKAEGYLNKYSILGLHENYNSAEMMARLEQDGVHFNTFERIFIREEISFNDAVSESFAFVLDADYGIELDLDSIENFPSSAQSPSGTTTQQARYFVHHLASSKNAIYLHLPEAAPSLVDGSAEQAGKLLAYLVSDFIKARK